MIEDFEYELTHAVLEAPNSRQLIGGHIRVDDGTLLVYGPGLTIYKLSIIPTTFTSLREGYNSLTESNQT